MTVDPTATAGVGRILFEGDVRHLADDVSSIAGFQGQLTEAKTATYCAESFINKQFLAAFSDQREKKENLILGNEFLKVWLCSPTSYCGEAQFGDWLTQRVRFWGELQPEYEFRCGFQTHVVSFSRIS